MTNEELVVGFQQGLVEFEEIIERNQGLIHKELNRWKDYALEGKDDKYNFLLVALWESALAFDTEAGVKFSTFATNNLYFKIKNAYRSATTKRKGGDTICMSIEGEMEKEAHRFEQSVSVETDFNDKLIADDIEAVVEKVLENYDDNKKQYVRSFLFENMTYTEVANQFSMRPQQMTTTIKRIMVKIQAELIKHQYRTA